MDTRIIGDRERSSRRPIRNKRYSRRSYGEEKRPPKRLFTPEIKRFLKDWLIRRRENPYPNRDEKKTLAIQTGLTYIQVCNWFANWRRKLKNAGKEPQRKTWGDLIKSYNNQVQGNVEHFSICSDDSIWGESEIQSNYDEILYDNDKRNLLSHNNNNNNNTINDHNYEEITSKSFKNNKNYEQIAQNHYLSMTSTTCNDKNLVFNEINNNPFIQSTNKYKNHIMEKYLRDCQKPPNALTTDAIADDAKIVRNNSKPSAMISKWLESAANFRPNENSYLNWAFPKNPKRKTRKIVTSSSDSDQPIIHGREELDAAEALTRLANARSFNK